MASVEEGRFFADRPAGRKSRACWVGQADDAGRSCVAHQRARDL